MNQPRVRNVACAAVLVFLAAVGALVRYEVGYPLGPFELFGRNSSSEGRQELRALRREAVLDFRAPSIRLRRAREVPARQGLVERPAADGDSPALHAHGGAG